MYVWIFRHLPDPTWFRVIESLTLIGAAVAALFTQVYPWVWSYPELEQPSAGGARVAHLRMGRGRGISASHRIYGRRLGATVRGCTLGERTAPAHPLEECPTMGAGEETTVLYMKGPVMARVLCVGNCDSFVFTIVGYLRHLGAIVDIMCSDVVNPVWSEAGYDGVLMPPGPGDPKSADASLQIIADYTEHGIPVPGVCLGHQFLGEPFDATVGHVPGLMYGKTSVITYDGCGVFKGVPSPLTVTRYCSLMIDPVTIPDELEVFAIAEPGIIMGVRHHSLPLEGVQSHPEPVMTQFGHLTFANQLVACGDADAHERAVSLKPAVVERFRL